jgi:hypothetical protein
MRRVVDFNKLMYNSWISVPDSWATCRDASVTTPAGRNVALRPPTLLHLCLCAARYRGSEAHAEQRVLVTLFPAVSQFNLETNDGFRLNTILGSAVNLSRNMIFMSNKYKSSLYMKLKSNFTGM